MPTTVRIDEGNEVVLLKLGIVVKQVLAPIRSVFEIILAEDVLKVDFVILEVICMDIIIPFQLLQAVLKFIL